MQPIRVLVVDDSAIVRKVLSEQLSHFPDILTDTAIDPYVARERIASNDFDVVLLDIEMPRMDGLTFLRHLMKHHPLPVIIVSSLAREHNDATMEALELGAVDIVPKPGGPFSVGEIIEVLAEKIRVAAKIRPEMLKALPPDADARKQSAGSRKVLSRIHTTRKLIAVGASTGGTGALETLLPSFRETFPPTVVVIHMPERFTATFAARLNSLCRVEVREAADGERLLDGTVYIAPGGQNHTQVRLSGADLQIRLVNAPRVNNFRPSVDVLFDSAAVNAGTNAIGVLLTGMGHDGALGLLEMKKRGGYTIAQDETSCVVFGMPREAIELGAHEIVLPLCRIASQIEKQLQRT